MRRFTVIDCDQKTPAWFAARVGRVTSSVAAAMLSKGRGSEEAAGKRNLRTRLALERIAGRSFERDFSSRYMEQGTEREPEAFGAYEALTGRLLERTGFCSHNDLMAGCSLDGSCDDFTGIIEIKCPDHSAHFEALKTNKVPSHYFKQVQHALYVTGAEWCDWLSYQPDFPESLRVKLIRVERDPAALDAYEGQLSLFLVEVDLEVLAIQTLANPLEQLAAAVSA